MRLRECEDAIAAALIELAEKVATRLRERARSKLRGEIRYDWRRRAFTGGIGIGLGGSSIG